ncbi:MAG: arylsulfotransferase family protein [Pseudomonadota bacterium]
MVLNPCGDIVWKSEPLRFHHSIHLDENMDLWAWRATKYDIGHYQFMSQVNGETGELLKEVSLIDDIIKQQPGSHLTFSLPEYYEFQKFLGDRRPAREYDIFHVNDLEPLRSDMADAFPLFEAGDLLASFRESNLVAVFDGDDYTIKWSQHGPWRLQHDADFNPDGTISLFSNNQPWGGSDIMVVEPVTREVSRPWASEEAKFYATSGGKHQILPNGSVLLSATQQGRVLEIAPGGELVMEYVNLVSPGTVGRLQNVMWFPLDFFDELPSCS